MREKHILSIYCLYLFLTFVYSPLNGQVLDKTLYVEFSNNSIIGNQAREDNLINLAINRGYKSLIFLDIGETFHNYEVQNSCTLSSEIELVNFISKAKAAGIQNFGISVGPRWNETYKQPNAVEELTSPNLLSPDIGSPALQVVSGIDQISAAITVPFSLRDLNGSVINQIFASTNGFIQLGTNSNCNACYANYLVNPNSNTKNIIAGLWDRLQSNVSVFTKTTTSGKKIFVINYDSQFINNAGNIGGSVQFQVQIYEDDQSNSCLAFKNPYPFHYEIVVNLVSDPWNLPKTIGINDPNGTIRCAAIIAGNSFPIDRTNYSLAGTKGWKITPAKIIDNSFYNVENYNNRHYNQKIELLSTEFEYWGQSSRFNPYYYSWNSFAYMLNKVYELKNNSTISNYSIEPYLNVFKDVIHPAISTLKIDQQSQADYIDERSDAVMLATYYGGYETEHSLELSVPGISHKPFPLYKDYAQCPTSQYPNGKYPGGRLKLFANNSWPTNIKMLYSAESFFQGEYIWMTQVSPWSDANGNYGYDNAYFGNTLPEDKLFLRTLDNLDVINPYNSDGTPAESDKWPDPSNHSLTLRQVTVNVPNGNVLVGSAWFKYGLIPDAGFYTQAPSEFYTQPMTAGQPPPVITLSSSASEGHDICADHNLTMVENHHVWHKWMGNGVINGGIENKQFIRFLGEYTDCCPTTTASGPYTYQPPLNPYFYGSESYLHNIELEAGLRLRNYPIRNRTIIYGAGVNPARVRPTIHPEVVDISWAQCPSFDNGIAIVTVYDDATSSNLTDGLIRWGKLSEGFVNSTIQYVSLPYSIENLDAGDYMYEITSNSEVYIDTISIGSMEFMKPTVHTLNNNSCDNKLSVEEAYESYQWKLNGTNLAVNSNSRDYKAIEDGSYSVLVTKNGCITESLPISIIRNPIFSITGDQNSCNGYGNFQATNGLNDELEYFWSVPNNAQISNYEKDLSIQWNSVPGGWVYCTATNACGNSTKDSIFVQPCCDSNWPKPQLTGSQSSCNITQYEIVNYDPQYENLYHWEAITTSGNAEFDFGLNNSSAEITWPNSGGTLTITMGDKVCNNSSSIIIEPCCVSTNTYYDGMNQFDITPNPSTSLNDITINGKFYITNDFAFENCGQVSFASGSKILVKAGKTLTIDNCTFSPGTCCKMWKGIELEPGAKIIMKNGSVIAQAEYGIMVNDGCLFDISSSYFRNNYVSIKIGTGSSTTISGSKIVSTEFSADPYTCGGSTYSYFVPGYNGQQISPGTYPLAGIMADNVTYLKIGGNTLVPGGDVRFRNLINGVVFNNSNFIVQNSTFKNMVGGCGISANGGSINLVGMGWDYATSENTFENCDYAIKALSCDLQVSSVKTSPDVNRGIYFQDCRNVNISECSISARIYGIHAYHNPDAEVSISKNNIHMSGVPMGYACIRLDEFSHGHPLSIDNNDLYLNFSRFGILTYSMHNALIKENYIQMNNNYNVAGICSYYSQGNTYQCNTVEALQHFNTNQSGIMLSLSPENWVTCNWVDNQYNGIRINGACYPIALEGNIFNDHNFGLALTYNAVIGVQENKGNTWNGTYTSYGAYLSGVNSSSAMANQFLFYDPSGNNTPATTNNDIMNFGWFEGNQNEDEFNCSNFNCQPFIPVGDDPRFEDEIIAIDDEIGTEYVDPSNYFADRYLFERLLENPELMTGNSILEAFYNQKVYGTIGQFSELNQEIEEAVKWETVYEMAYSTNENMIRMALDSLDMLDSLLENGYTGGTNYDALNLQIENLMASNSAIMASIEQIKTYRVENSIDDNSTIPVSELYEENEAIVNDIYLSTIASGEWNLTSSQMASLLTIAEQCPFNGGPSVYMARSIYHLVDPSADWDDDAVCVYQGVLPRIRNPYSDRLQTLYPNPTTGIVTVNYVLQKGENGLVEIYSAYGQKVLSKSLDSNNAQADLDLTSFTPALYHYRIIVNDVVQEKGTISVVR